MAKLQLQFTGLCAFVPNDDSAATRARTLLVDARKANAPHFPMLIAFKSAWQGSGRRYDDTFEDAAGVEMVYWRLDDQDLWILGASDKKLSIHGQTEEILCPPEDINLRSNFGWVAPMYKINRPNGAPSSRAWGKVKDSCLTYDQVDRSVVARVSLTEGILKTLSHAIDDQKNVIKWRFQIDPFDPPIDHIQSLAEEAQLEGDFPGDYIGFGARKDIHERDPSELDPIYIKPVVTGRPVQVWISNMEWEMVVGRKYDEEVYSRGLGGGHFRLFAQMEREGLFALGEREKKGKRNPDYDFKLFYDLVDGPRSRRAPYPEDERCDGEDDPSVDNPKCPPIQLSASSIA